MKNIAIYGAGGFGREIACLIKQINLVKPQWNLVGFFDDGVRAGESNRYGVVLGNIDTLNSYSHNLSLVIAIATPDHIRKIVKKIVNPLIDFPNIFAPNVIIFDQETLAIGKGNIVFFGCRLSCDVKIGNFNLLNGLVSLGHDVKIGNYNVLQPSARLSGESIVGDENFFGVQSVVLQGIRVGSNTRIGANSVVMQNTKDNNLYFGNPARITIFR
jgi:sugar O-acyltransferase (sialic acid O-acetyltransferase NeuD family)